MTIKLEFIPEFQYILCYGSTFFCTAFYRRRKHFNTSYVTVQLIPTHNKNPPKNISIHLMLRFNYINTTCSFNFIFISIHLMLRFNFDVFFIKFNYARFQYILCYGSTILQCAKQTRSYHFNTSYVTVQLLHLCILYFSSYQIVVAVSTFFIIFSNDKYFFSQKSKTSLKA